MKKFFILILALFTTKISPINAQESKVLINTEGKDFTALKYAWRAQWITHPTASTLDFGAFLFRRSFQLKDKPKKFVIHITADNHYRLYVNGEYIGSGPETGDINHYPYESRNIANALHVGDNILAIEVMNYGEYRKAAQQSFQTALICQFDDSLRLQELNTGVPGWKVIKNEGRGITPFTSDSMRGYYAAGPGDILNCNLIPWGWEKLNYNDSLWLTPKKATVEFAVGRGFLFGSTWFLVPRTLPYLAEKKEIFSKYSMDGKINHLDSNKKFDIYIPANSHKKILLDNRTHTIGFPELHFSDGSNSKIKLTYAEALYDSTWNKGNRNEIAGKHIFGYYDLIFPDGGKNRRFKPTSMRTYRFIELDVVTRNEPLTISDFYGVRTTYPFNVDFQFQCDNDTLNQIWEISKRTLLNSSVEDFIDPYYEQMQYIGDARIEALCALSISDDYRLFEKAMKSFDHSRLPIGLTQSRYPSYIVQVIPTYSLLWIAMIHDYMMYVGNKKFIEERMDGIENVLKWFEKKLDKNGMLTHLEWWNFTDWASGFQNGIPPGADDGYSAAVTLQYVYALQNATAIYQYLGKNQISHQYKKKAAQIAQSVKKLCFDVKKNLFADTPEKNSFSQHTNIFAILTQAEAPKNHIPLMQKILTDTSLTQATIYFKFYLFEALEKSGLAHIYTSQLANWKTMIQNGQTTFAETDHNPRSECHAWSASPLYHFNKLILGIKPIQPGFNHVLIQPNFGSIKHLNTKIPTVHGQIDFRLEENTVTISLPQKMTAIFRYKGKNTPLSQGEQTIFLNP